MKLFMWITCLQSVCQPQHIDWAGFSVWMNENVQSWKVEAEMMSLNEQSVSDVNKLRQMISYELLFLLTKFYNFCLFCIFLNKLNFM